MNNFFRAVRIALGYRLLVAVAIICALLVAVLWGANIGTVYPFVEVAIQGQSLQEWVDGEIEESRRAVAELEAELASLDEPPGGSEGAETDRRREKLAVRLEAERGAMARSEWLRPYIYRLMPADPFQTLVLIAGLLVLGTLLKSVFVIAQTVLVHRLALLTTLNLRTKFFRRTLRMNVSSFDEESSAALMSRFTYDMEGVSSGIKSLFGKTVREPLKMIACLVGAAMICWRLLVLSLVVAPIAAYCIGRIAKLLKSANRRAMEEMSQLYGTLEETLGGIKIVKAFTMERYERRRFHQNCKKFFHKAMRIAKYDALTKPTTEVMGIITICLAILAGAYLVLNDQTHLLNIRMSNRPLTLASLLLFYGMLAGTSDPFRKISDVYNRLQRAAAACDRIYAMIDREPAIADPSSPQPLQRHHLDLAFERVRFEYKPGQPVLEEIDLRIGYGESIALVGPNGCGKSTLVNLVPRFFDPDEGTVRLDGVDLRDARLRDLRRQIGLVTQETLLFDDTVRNNIRYGSPHATAEEVVAAARRAQAHKFIEEALSDGYDTLVGQRGGQLSGGQRQRIALARAILRDPAILILDEATSQIDLESEQVIQRVLEEFMQDRTTILITHRLAALTLADRIVVMDAGRIADVGTHDELLGRCHLYRRLHDLQFRQSA